MIKSLVRYDDSVHREAKQAMIGNGETSTDFEVDVFCACVDGLTPELNWVETKDERYRKGGLAFLHGRSDQIVPDVWGGEAREGNLSTFAGPAPSSITFSSYQEPQDQKPVTEVTLPLANTLFVSGEEYTMFVSKWRFNGDDELYERVKSKDKTNQVINVFGDTNRGFPPGRVPVIPLTPPRRITSGLGNIIRELAFDDGAKGPASLELHHSVVEYMDLVKYKESGVKAWALVTPSESMPDPPPGEHFEYLNDLKSIKEFWGKGGYDTSFIGHWLERGATFCSIGGMS